MNKVLNVVLPYLIRSNIKSTLLWPLTCLLLLLRLILLHLNLSSPLTADGICPTYQISQIDLFNLIVFRWNFITWHMRQIIVLLQEFIAVTLIDRIISSDTVFIRISIAVILRD